MIKSERLYFKKMKIEDVYKFKDWGMHKTQLLDDYNFVEKTDEEVLSWYNWKTKSPNSLYYTIFFKDRAIGYISFKNMSSILKTSELGIVLDPNYIDKGFGCETLMTMLNFYFFKLKYNKIYLDVAQYNKRAYYLYSKIGFKKYATVIMKYHKSKLDKKSQDYIENRDVFFSFIGLIFFKADKMVLTREKFGEIV